jgi:hypothetical protein
MIHDIYFGGYYCYMYDRLVRLPWNANSVSWNANSVVQTGVRRAELQHAGNQMMDSAMVAVSVQALLVYKEYCVQVGRF